MEKCDFIQNCVDRVETLNHSPFSLCSLLDPEDQNIAASVSSQTRLVKLY